MTAERRWTVVIRLDVDHSSRDIIFDRDAIKTPHGGPGGILYNEGRAREVFALMAVQWSSRGERYRIMLLHGAEEIDRAVVGGKAMN